MIARVCALLALLLHATTASRYGYFRDELYFIACSKHLAWGYVDQPPLVAVAAWLSAPFGYAPSAMRALPVIASALTCYFAVALTSELGGGRFAQLLAGIATLLLPGYLLLGNTLTTSSFEPLFWTLAIYLVVRIAGAPASRRSRLWLALGFVTALGMYGKYSMLLPIAGLVIGLAATSQRRILRTPYAGYAAGVAILLLLPNLVWQGAHGWPILEVLRGDLVHRPSFAAGFALEYRDWAANAKAFLLEQLLYTNPLAAPIWLTGTIAPFRVAALRPLRFVSIAYLVVLLAAIALEAKGYYIIGFYAALLAIGAVVIERAGAVVRWGVLCSVTLVGLAAMPLSLPILPVDGLIAYTQGVGLTGRSGSPARLIQPVFAEEFGWDRLARNVAAVYFSLPPDERASTAIYADTYGDAAALDFFGPHYRLPAAISSQNNYYLWGTRGYTGTTLIAIGATRIDLLRRFYRSCVLVRTSTEPYKWIVEGPAPIYLCRDSIAPLSEIWPHLRWYGA